MTIEPPNATPKRTSTKTKNGTKTAARDLTISGGGTDAGRAPGPTMAEFAEAYLKHLEAVGKSRSTVFSYSIDLGLAVRELGAETRLKSLTAKKVGAFFESYAVTTTRTGRDKAKPTVDKTRRILRLALTWGAETGLIPGAPLPDERVGRRRARANAEDGEAKKRADDTDPSPKRAARRCRTRRSARKPSSGNTGAVT